jgi:hypothetical protein
VTAVSSRSSISVSRNDCVNVNGLLGTLQNVAGPEAAVADIGARTIWHRLYDQHAGTVEFRFYLGQDVAADGTRTERRSAPITFALDPVG